VFGHVTDFFDLDTPIRALQTFPVFNVADSALTVGVVLMLISMVMNSRKTVVPTAPLDSNSS
jgi:lipoprotein signal peptidase